jgi:hypothetical protein
MNILDTNLFILIFKKNTASTELFFNFSKIFFNKVVYGES